MRVDPIIFAAKLRDEGMRHDDISQLIDWLKKVQAGRRLIPHHSYRTYVFNPAPEADNTGIGETSEDW